MIQQTVFPFKLEVTGERLTAHGGLSLLAEFNHGIGLRELVDRNLPRPGSNRGFMPSRFVDTLVLMLQAGGRSLEDVRELKFEQGLMKLLGNGVVPDPDTMGDWLRRMGSGVGLKGLDRVREKINHRLLGRDGISEYTLDADATEITGDKDEAFFTYNGNKGYMPMLGFLYESGLCIYDEFREGNVSPGFGQLEFYRECKARMPEGRRIGRYRADSASYQAGVINELEGDGVMYAITAVQDAAVKAQIRAISEGGWKEPERGCGFEVAETVHTMEKTARAFRLVVKRWRRVQEGLFEEGGYFYHAVATNWSCEDKDGWEVFRWHNERGQAENFLKEVKTGFGMERMPCGQTHANAVFFRVGVIAYNLFIGFKRLACPDSWSRHTIVTFRWKLVQVAGRIVRHAGMVVLKLAVDIEKLELFRGIRRRVYELSLSTVV